MDFKMVHFCSYSLRFSNVILIFDLNFISIDLFDVIKYQF